MNREPHYALHLAWLFVILLMPVAMLNYLDRQMMASMQGSVMADIPEFQIAKDPQSMWGYMLGQFKWVYAGFSLVGGFVADRFSRKWTICASLFAWSAITWWTGQVTSYDELLRARAWMGISEAFYFPAALALIADYHAAATRSRAIGLHQMAIYTGVIVGGFGGYVAELPDLGWRFAFSTCGLVGMLYAIPLMLLLRDAPSWRASLERSKETLGSEMATERPSLFGLITNRSFLLLVLYFTLPAMAAWIVRDWMPAILKKEFGIGQGHAGVAATIYWQVAAIAGAFVGGWVADRWVLRNPRGRMFTSALGVAFIIPAIFGVGNASSLTMAVLFLILFGLGWGFFDCNNMPILSQIVSSRDRALGYGVMNFVSISCGGLADWGFGKLRDQNVPLNTSFAIFASFALISIVLVLKIRPRPDLQSS